MFTPRKASIILLLFLAGGKADPFIQIRKAHGTVKGPGGTSTDFVAPIENKYMGTKDKESLLYNGERDHCPNTLDPVFKAVEFSDVTRYMHSVSRVLAWRASSLTRILQSLR